MSLFIIVVNDILIYIRLLIFEHPAKNLHSSNTSHSLYFSSLPTYHIHHSSLFYLFSLSLLRIKITVCILARSREDYVRRLVLFILG